MKKSKTRIFVKKTISSNLLIYIEDKQYHFLKNVIRVKLKDQINLFDGITGEWSSNVISINKNNIVLKIMQNICKFKKSNDIWLVFSPIKQQKIGITVQKATELGVSKIIPCFTEYTNRKNININSLIDNTIEAAEQCGRLDVPNIEDDIDLNKLLSKWPVDRKLIFCDEKNYTGKMIIESLIDCKNSKQKWGVLIGPEGGFSELERKTLLSNKYVISVSLGSRVLRSDTASTVALYCMHELLF